MQAYNKGSRSVYPCMSTVPPPTPIPRQAHLLPTVFLFLEAQKRKTEQNLSSHTHLTQTFHFLEPVTRLQAGTRPPGHAGTRRSPTGPGTPTAVEHSFLFPWMGFAFFPPDWLGVGWAIGLGL